MARPQFEEVLARYSLREIRVRRWQANYDLALARKAGQPRAASEQEREPVSLLRCPACGGSMERRLASLACTGCGQVFRIHEGVINLVVGEGPPGR